ncbi:MAG: DUF4288 domain-containing protein [Bacteroidetes bacterium]|nr:DUF4288 domain-containing protein [Bacteroidota bacterium]
MNWYISKIVFEIAAGGSSQLQCDVQYRLLHARNADEALELAFAMGRQEEAVFVNVHGQTVSCNFAGVAALHALDAPSHGLLIFSESVENCTESDIAAMLKFRAPLAHHVKEGPCEV